MTAAHAPHVARALRVLAVISLLVALASCSATDDADTDPDVTEPEIAALDVVVTDPGGVADPLRLAELSEAVSAALAAGTGPTESCPLGAPDTFVHGTVGPLAELSPFSNDVQASGAAGDVPTVACASISWVEAEVSVLPGGTTIDDLVTRISAPTMRPTISEPQPLLGGQAFLVCQQAESTSTLFVCNISWVLDDLLVHVEVSSQRGEPQQLADYLSAALPGWVGAAR